MILMSEGIDVVGEAANGDEALRVVRRTRPDVVLMDIRMPGMDGLEATRQILAEDIVVDRGDRADRADRGDRFDRGDWADGDVASPDRPRIIILTTFDLDQYVYAAITAGASGFLLKDVSPEHLVAAVNMVREGDAMLAPAITRRLVERFAVPMVNPRIEALHKDLATLTPREREVLGLLGRGLSNAELAARFHLSEATVKTHVARILAKLNLRDRAQAVVVAYETGLIKPGVA
ncbi:response regulator [Catenulispora sp. MAP5-51]|uniref:response regulator n=1 Tax=Catenulispora sp. MAP5-51 TaxID=3156298 RepID=UPI00351219EF